MNEPAPADLPDLVTRALDAALAEIEQLRPVSLATCLHEAAHAVVGWVVGDRPLIEVVVLPSGAGLTRRESVVSGVGDDAALLRSRCEVAIVAVYAGLEADLRCTRSYPAFADIALIDRLASYVIDRGDAQGNWLRGLRAIAADVIHDQKPVIDALARLLQQRRRLTGAEVEQFCRAYAFTCDYLALPDPDWRGGRRREDDETLLDPEPAAPESQPLGRRHDVRADL